MTTYNEIFIEKPSSDHEDQEEEAINLLKSSQHALLLCHEEDNDSLMDIRELLMRPTMMVGKKINLQSLVAFYLSIRGLLRKRSEKKLMDILDDLSNSAECNEASFSGDDIDIEKIKEIIKHEFTTKH